MTTSKKMKRDPYQIITDRVCEILESGTVPWRKPWRGGEGGMPRNLKSGKAYRGVNVFTLALAGFSSPYFLTYKQAKDLGGQVRKGERGMPVVFWKWLKRTEVDEATGEESTKTRPMLRLYTVFNVEQCDGLNEHPAVVEREDAVWDDNDPIPACEAVVAGYESAPTIEHVHQSAWYRPSTDTVNVPEIGLFDSPEAYYSTMFHELGHSTGHASRLGRKSITDLQGFGTHSYSREELIAEMTAAFLCGMTGIEGSTLDNSAAYLAHWMERLREDNRLIVVAAQQAQKAADLILGNERPQA